MLLTFACGASLFSCAAAWAEMDAEGARKVAKEAYVFGYPLLAMETSKWVMAKSEASVNRFNHAKTFPDATFTDVVSPNADTLYSQAWLDLSASPVVLTVPEIEAGRYYVMQCLDGWTNVFTSVGTRETGNGAGVYLLTGPGWSGEVPINMTHLVSPTNLVWILGRTETRGKTDYNAVHAIQAGYGLEMLNPNAVIPPPSPGTDTATAPSAQMDALDDPDVFYARLCRLMGENPPSADDADLLAQMVLIGMTPGADYDPATLSEDIRAAIATGFAEGRASVIEDSQKSQGTKNGVWSVMPDNIGNFGTDYTFRATIARIAIGANLPEEAMYPSTRVDNEGNPLDGANAYTIRFAPGQLPPVDAFWSITMYDEHQFFVDNPIDRYAIGDRDALIADPDGAVTIYVQHKSPGADLEPNWLPAPAGSFNLIMRLYLPDETILNGSWPMPDLQKTEQGASGSSGCNTNPLPLAATLLLTPLLRRKK